MNASSDISFSTKSFGKVAVLMGGWSAEREVSLKSGSAVLQALKLQGIDAHAIDVQHETVIADLLEGNFDCVFNILHGRGGEDGIIQGMLEVMQIPYTGTGVLGSALAMDKVRTKQILEGANLPTPKYMILDDDTDLNYVLADLGLPLMIKPALEGSSIGMTKVVHEDQVQTAYEQARQYKGAVIAEQWIEGQEYTVAILGEEVLPAIQLETPHDFYDYQAKYISDDTRYHCPCGLSTDEEASMQRLALSAFHTIGAEGWGRVDFMCDSTGKPYVIELNTVPGMTDHSLVPMAARAAGIEFNELVYRILELALSKSGKVSYAGGDNRVDTN